LRTLCAALLSHSEFTVSTGIELPRGVRNVLVARGTALVSESDAAWLARLSGQGQVALSNLVDNLTDDRISRVRVVSRGGLTASAVDRALSGTPDVAVWAHEVTNSGRVELLPFIHEQAISITAHRFGNPNPVIAALDIR
jgi:RHH-type proline utilization regulon transcriptional repressor/proline dehydrogenase/delta 1-pyrroline-5-carboxylate dehydrogenase